MIQAWCPLAVLKTFFLWMFKVFSLLSIQQIDNIFQLPNTILIIEMASTVFKTDRKILSNVKIEIFLPALNYACVTWSTEEKKNTPSMKCHWHKDVIVLFLTNLTAHPRLQLVIDIKFFFLWLSGDWWAFFYLLCHFHVSWSITL